MQTQVKTCTVDVWNGQEWYSLKVDEGNNLRDLLRNHRMEPVGTEARIHCGGQCKCGTCAVVVEGDQPQPAYRLDEVLYNNGYRLSCAIEVDRDMTVYLA